jgi:hypothetical protein
LKRREYLRRFEREVGPVRSMPVPYWALMLMSRAVEWYHRYSKGQLPPAFTPYATRTLYRSRRIALKPLGWRQIVSTEEGHAPYVRMASRRTHAQLTLPFRHKISPIRPFRVDRPPP